MNKKSRKRTRRITALAVGITALAIAAFATRDEWSALAKQRAEASNAETRKQAAEKKYADLAEQRARLETPAGQEKQAREMGYRKPGEETMSTR
jgi:hypothetical protein